jgi:23S rRNA (guanosine2251-2'-O)-methyltransferase
MTQRPPRKHTSDKARNQPRHDTKHKEGRAKTLFLHGKHACIAALNNKNRQIINLYVTKNFDISALPARLTVKPQLITNDEIGRFINDEAVHQGIIVETQPLNDPGISYIEKNGGIIVVLDQVTDPHNIGAVLRTAAAFNATAIVIPKDNAPEESATLAKTASGALEIVPIIRVTNLVRAIEELKKHGYWFIGMDGDTETAIGDIKDISRNTGLVMGAEGKGLRRLTRDACDFIAKIPISNHMESLNVSNAAAIGLYCLSR